MEYDNFESALEELKNIVRKFENKDDISIDELLENYEKGMKAYSFCMKKLDDTQRKIKIIDENIE
ncbi:MAG TPA: exodeoxyribonuclease VII small subunit [Sedimentibacter sp.]|jgi:exodeoxyribonuclease VII small subunit|nr:exodeoxyribonuclease VII small subunit [Sedimentibacter sp.]NLA14057.1 exodeoxyribonuclease VII small subunit [Tissierellia bacterium]HAS91086.1 exodeoxyribonuclease VII small subunit [Clostridiales bacterium]HOA19321.1 exodeoxyribonuclease VII small subunit [Sedimentibacter sp.]HOG62608.1 exodeoxyribonuclease VII small subunit [Sedimentibacter sp.]